MIGADGEVRPCELRGESFGNLRDVDYEFANLWRSRDKQAFCTGIRESRCSCTHELWAATSVAYSPGQWPTLLRGVSGSGA